MTRTVRAVENSKAKEAWFPESLWRRQLAELKGWGQVSIVLSVERALMVMSVSPPWLVLRGVSLL